MSNSDNSVVVEFPKKWKKYLPAGFEDTVNTIDLPDIKSKIVEYSKDISQTENNMDADLKLADAKEQVKDLSEPYKDIINANKAMIKYLVYTMKMRGA